MTESEMTAREAAPEELAADAVTTRGRGAAGRGTSAGGDAPQSPAESEAGLFPIRTVSSLTRVNPVTLRAWERRYGLVRPRRTPKGHRLYTQQDIELINRIVDLLEQGIPISRVPQALRSTVNAPAGTENGGDGWSLQVERMLEAVSRFNESALNIVYNEALALYPVDVVTQRLVLPVLAHLGERWRREEGGVAEEHFFGTFLRNKLGARFHHMGARADGPLLVTACLPGERHEVGLMLFSLSAAERGYRLVQLGPDMPLGELHVAARRADAAAVVLSGSVDPEPGLLENDLPGLVRRVSVPVLLGGRTAVRHHDAVRRAGAHPIGVEMESGLRRLEEALAGREPAPR